MTFKSLEETLADGQVRRDEHAQREAAWRCAHARFARNQALIGAVAFGVLFALAVQLGVKPIVVLGAWFPGAVAGWWIGRWLLGPTDSALMCGGVALAWGALGFAFGGKLLFGFLMVFVLGLAVVLGLALGWRAEAWDADHAQI